MKNIGLIIKMFSIFYVGFFPVSIVAIEFILRLLTPFGIFSVDLKSEFLFKLALFDVPPVVIMTAAFYNSKIKKKQ